MIDRDPLPTAAVAATAGAVDAALFAATRRELFRKKPRRALSSVALTGAWAALAATAGRGGQRRPGPVTQAMAGLLCAANTAMLAAHLARRVATPRVFLGPALSAIALADVLRRR